MTADLRLPTVRRRLTTRLLLWTAGFVILAEVLVYVPSIARFRAAAGHGFTWRYTSPASA